MFEKKRMQSVQILEEIKKQDERLKQQGMMQETAVYGKRDNTEASKGMDASSDMEPIKAAPNTVPNMEQMKAAGNTVPNMEQMKAAGNP